MKKVRLLTCILLVSVGPLAVAQNLVGRWTFEGNLLDSSGNNNNGTATGTVGFARGRFGQALDLRSGAGHVTIPNSPSLQTPTFTVAYWAYLPYAQDPVIADKRNLGDSESSWQVNLSSFDNVNMNLQGCLVAPNGSGCSYSANLSPSPVGFWTHVAVTYDGSTMNGYVNGNLVLTWNPTGTPGTQTADILLGTSPQPKQFFGLLDEVRIYDGALTAAQVSLLANAVPTHKNQCENGGWQFLMLPNGTVFNNQAQCIQYVNILAPNLVGRWSFQGNLLDSSGNNNNGTATGTVGFAPGKFGQALDLTAGAGHVTIPNSPSLQTANFTVAYWAYLPYAQDPVIADKRNLGDSESSWQVNLSSFDNVNMNLQGCLVAPNGPGCYYSATLTPSPVGHWTHVAVTYAPTTMNGYVNGNLVLTWNPAGTPWTQTADILLGTSPQPQPFFGLLDELRIYDGPLTAAQVYLLAHPVPTHKNQCKNGGWQFLMRPDGTVFNNEGLCIHYVQTGK